LQPQRDQQNQPQTRTMLLPNEATRLHRARGIVRQLAGDHRSRRGHFRRRTSSPARPPRQCNQPQDSNEVHPNSRQPHVHTSKKRRPPSPCSHDTATSRWPYGSGARPRESPYDQSGHLAMHSERSVERSTPRNKVEDNRTGSFAPHGPTALRWSKPMLLITCQRRPRSRGGKHVAHDDQAARH